MSFNGSLNKSKLRRSSSKLFSFKEEDVKNLKITTPSETIVLERSQDGKSKWLMKSPDNVPANDGTVAYLLNLLETEKSDRTLNVPQQQLSEFGLKQPRATIDITLNNQKTHKLVLGKPNFDNRFLYAQNNIATKPDGNIEVVLVSKNFENAVNRSLSEWKAVDNSKISPSPSPGATTTSTPGATQPFQLLNQFLLIHLQNLFLTIQHRNQIQLRNLFLIIQHQNQIQLNQLLLIQPQTLFQLIQLLNQLQVQRQFQLKYLSQHNHQSQQQKSKIVPNNHALINYS